MPTILAFDTATSVTSCALVRDGALLGERTTNARSLLAATDDLLEDAGLTTADLDALVVGTGPGSFTSIRMGLATARGLGFALALPVAGVSTLLGFAGGEPGDRRQARRGLRRRPGRRPARRADRERSPPGRRRRRALPRRLRSGRRRDPARRRPCPQSARAPARRPRRTRSAPHKTSSRRTSAYPDAVPSA